MLTLHLGGDFGVLDWKFQNFWNFFVGGGKWTTVFRRNGSPHLNVVHILSASVD
jgi:hypothetical protein